MPTVTHATFVIERDYPAAPGRVFTAWSDPVAKSRWFGDPAQSSPADYDMDFRVGGREVNKGGPEGGPTFTFVATYYDIVPDQRIVYSYEMFLDDTRISVSLATVELTASGAGTTLRFTEQSAFLDDGDNPADREKGTRDLLTALDAEVSRQTGDA